MMRTLPWLFTFLATATTVLLQGASTGASCSTSFTRNKVETTYGNCTDLRLQSAAIAWSYSPETLLLEVAFSGEFTNSEGWVGWGINPTTPDSMVGSSVLVAFTATNGTNLLPYKLTEKTISYTPLSCSAIDLEAVNSSVEIQQLKVVIFASLKLKVGQSVLYQIWNRGPDVVDFQPQRHDFNGNSLSTTGTLDISTGIVSVASAPPHQTLKNRHGIISAVGWGILIPLGIMSARYMRPFEALTPLWFYLHANCQLSGYILGVAGFALGLRLQSYSNNIHYKHRNIGIAIFSFGTLQVLAVLTRPKPDHKSRKFWNVYHAAVGYSVLVMAIVNIFEGLSILSPAGGWRHAYIAILASLGAISLVFEISIWSLYFIRTRRSPPMRLEEGASGSATPNHSKAMTDSSNFTNGSPVIQPR